MNKMRIRLEHKKIVLHKIKINKIPHLCNNNNHNKIMHPQDYNQQIRLCFKIKVISLVP